MAVGRKKVGRPKKDASKRRAKLTLTVLPEVIDQAHKLPAPSLSARVEAFLRERIAAELGGGSNEP